MTKELLIAYLYSGFIDEKELVRLSLEVNKVIYLRYGMSCKVIMKRICRNLIWCIYFIKVPKTYKIQKDIRVFKGVDNTRYSYLSIISIYRKCDFKTFETCRAYQMRVIMYGRKCFSTGTYTDLEETM